MSEDFKEACRLIFECADELRLHDEEYQHRTTERLKDRLRKFLSKYNLTDPEKMADELCIK